MRVVRVKFKSDTKEGREICDAISKAEGSELLQTALRNHLQSVMREGLRLLTR